MLLSRKLFNEFFPNFSSIENDELERMLNSIGIEVESIFKFKKIDNLVVGHIIECNPHPNSIKLNVCKVDIGTEIVQIVCGAENARKDIKVILALPGANLPSLTIGEREIMGIKSFGMICAYNELTNRNDYVGDEEMEKIIELDNNAIVGDRNPEKYIGLDDEILDLSIPSNRNELNGIISLGFDLLNIFFPEIVTNTTFDFNSIKKNNITLNVDKNICSFFGCIKLSKFRSSKSSWKIKSYLMNSGYKPKNIFVDISNLNTIITGNPSHCYNAAFVKNEMTVKINDDKISFIGLNKKVYEINKEESIIVESNNKCIALAGIIGSDDSASKNEIEDVVYEIGNFNNLFIRRTSDNLNIKNDTSLICSKKIPLWITLKSFETLIHLLEKSNSNFDGINFTNYYLSQKEINFDYEKINELLGTEYSQQELKKVLKNIGFNIEKNKIISPIYREDIENIFDVVEEVLKKIDINSLPVKKIESTSIDFDFNLKEDNIKKIVDKLLNIGFSQVKTLNLTSESKQNKYNLFSANQIVKIDNPISSERGVFRTSVIGQLIEIAALNFAKKNKKMNIFELTGVIYDNKWNQHLCLLVLDDLFKNKINDSKIKNDLFLLKGIVSDIAKSLNIEINFQKIINNNKNIFVQNNSLRILLNNKTIGFIGQISPNICKEEGLPINNSVYAVEINIEEMIYSERTHNVFVKPENTLHEINRVLTITINENESFEKIEKSINDLVKEKYIKNTELESVYKNDNEISYTYSFDIDRDKLNEETQENINKIFNEIISILEKKELKIKK